MDLRLKIFEERRSSKLRCNTDMSSGDKMAPFLASELSEWPQTDMSLFVNNSIGNNILALFSRKSNSRIANVRLSVCLSVCYKNLSELLLSAIEPIDHWAYWLSSLLTIKPIDHWAYWPLSLLTIEPIDHQAYIPSSLLTIRLINHRAYWPSGLSTIEPIDHQAWLPWHSGAHER